MTKKLFTCAALFALLSAPILAQVQVPLDTVAASCDYWFTPTNGAKVKNVTIPAGLLCNGTDLTISEVLMKHHPLANTGNLVNVDTVLTRPNDIVLTNGVGTGPLQILALSLESTNYLNITCANGATVPYRVYAYLYGPQNYGSITIRKTNNCGGKYDANFEVIAAVKFEDAAGNIYGPIYEDPSNPPAIASVNQWWNETQGAGGIHNSQPTCFDTDWDMIPDSCCNGVPNFYPGWKKGTTCGAAPVAAPTQHTGPHPTTCSHPSCPPPPPPPTPICDIDIIDALKSFTVKGAFDVKGAAAKLESSRDARNVTEDSLKLVEARLKKCIGQVGFEILSGKL